MRSQSRQQTLNLLFASLLSSTALLLNSCSSVAIKDHEFCADTGSQGAACFHFLTTDHRDIPKPEWDDMRFGQICTNDPPGQIGATYADWKKVIEQLCSKRGLCDYETKMAVENISNQMQTMLDKAQGIKDASSQAH